jgi:hypothetical protein
MNQKTIAHFKTGNKIQQPDLSLKGKRILIYEKRRRRERKSKAGIQIAYGAVARVRPLAAGFKNIKCGTKEISYLNGGEGL